MSLFSQSKLGLLLWCLKTMQTERWQITKKATGFFFAKLHRNNNNKVVVAVGITFAVRSAR